MTLKVIFTSCTIISVCIYSCNAFWWNQASTTEAPVQTVKQIPLGYFRTYTYQPVGAPAPYSFSIVGTAAHPFNWPTKVPPAPMLSGTRYELYPLPTSTEKVKPTPTTTTTTTTTSTAPPSPPPTPNPTQSPLQAQDRMAVPLINTAGSISMASKYFDQSAGYSQYQGGIYNRRSLPYYQPQANFYRPYPYPEYSAPNPRSSVQFVPCMCPISVPPPANDLTESRTLPEGEQIVLLESTDTPNEGGNSAENIVELTEDIEKKSN